MHLHALLCLRVKSWIRPKGWNTVFFPHLFLWLVCSVCFCCWHKPHPHSYHDNCCFCESIKRQATRRVPSSSHWRKGNGNNATAAIYFTSRKTHWVTERERTHIHTHPKALSLARFALRTRISAGEKGDKDFVTMDEIVNILSLISPHFQLCCWLSRSEKGISLYSSLYLTKTIKCHPSCHRRNLLVLKGCLISNCSIVIILLFTTNFACQISNTISTSQ